MSNSRLFADTFNGTASVNMQDYARAGYSLIAIKASEGTGFIDFLHAGRSRRAHDEGLTVLHYHFARPDEGSSAIDEAQLFARVVRPTWRPGDYLALDIERTHPNGSGATTDWCKIFVTEAYRLLDATPIIYGSESFLRDVIGGLKVKGERYWPAKYGPGRALGS